MPAAASPTRPSGPGRPGRFLPGAMLAGRYRMVGLLGRGGIGEVYRADDLKLGQPVALKFLPRDVEQFQLPLTAPWWGLPPPAPLGLGAATLAATSRWLAVLCAMALESFWVPVLDLTMLLIFRVALRKPWLATSMFFLVVASLQFLFMAGDQLATLTIGSTLIAGAIGLVVLTRFGLFAFVVTVFFSSWNRLALTTDPGSWYFGQSALTMALFAAIAVYGFWLSVRGQLTFRDPVLDGA